MTRTTHTPGPWIVDKEMVDKVNGGEVYPIHNHNFKGWVGDIRTKEDAALIVQAVNEREEILACQDALRGMIDDAITLLRQHHIDPSEPVGKDASIESPSIGIKHLLTRYDALRTALLDIENQTREGGQLTIPEINEVAKAALALAGKGD